MEANMCRLTSVVKGITLWKVKKSMYGHYPLRQWVSYSCLMSAKDPKLSNVYNWWGPLAQVWRLLWDWSSVSSCEQCHLSWTRWLPLLKIIIIVKTMKINQYCTSPKNASNNSPARVCESVCTCFWNILRWSYSWCAPERQCRCGCGSTASFPFLRAP